MKSLMLFSTSLTLVISLIFPLRNAQAQLTGFVIGKQISEIGRSISEYRQLSAERRAKIESLKQQIARCGSCPEKSALSEELAYWLEVEERVKSVEHAALSNWGLGQYNNFGELGEAIKKGLITGVGIKRGSQINEARRLSSRYCLNNFKTTGVTDVNELNRLLRAQEYCVKENDYRLLLSYRDAAKELCNRRFDPFNPRYPQSERQERLGVYQTCMASNDILTNMCLDEERYKYELQLEKAERLKEQGKRLHVVDHSSKCYTF